VFPRHTVPLELVAIMIVVCILLDFWLFPSLSSLIDVVAPNGSENFPSGCCEVCSEVKKTSVP